MMIDDKYGRELQTVFAYIRHNINRDREELEAYIASHYFLFLPEGEYRESFIRDICDRAVKDEENEKPYCLSTEELLYLSSIEEQWLKKIILCLILWRREEDEHRSYVKFDFDKIFSLLFSPKEIKGLKREDLAPLSKYGIDFRVIGSKKPKTCYKLPVAYGADIAWIGSKDEIKDLIDNNVKNQE